jgi:hypothetical protein
MIAQRQLNLSISQRTVLVNTEALRAALGVDAETIYAKVDSGEFRWVWDVSTGGGEVRELRFWVREITAPQSVVGLDLAAVLAAVLGSERQRWQGVELAQMLLISRPQVKRLSDAGELAGDIVSGKLWVRRSVVEKFLNARLVK